MYCRSRRFLRNALVLETVKVQLFVQFILKVGYDCVRYPWNVLSK